MGVVVIIGILSVLAVVSYRKILLSSHTSEATQMVGSIKVAQEAYHAEVGTYLSISGNLSSDYCPTLPTNSNKVAWDPTCGTGADKPWSKLPVNPNGAVQFGYATVAGLSGVSVTWPNSMESAPPATTPTSDWFIAAARGDADGNGVYCTVVGDSFSRDIYVDRDTE